MNGGGNNQNSRNMHFICMYIVCKKKNSVVITVTETALCDDQKCDKGIVTSIMKLNIFEDTQLHCYTRELKKRDFSTRV
jgi:hypothetical protein